MRLMLIGAPASGKGTQAKRLARHFDIGHVSTGDMLRRAVAERTDLGLVVEHYLKHGWLVPDHHVMTLVRERLSNGDISSGFILDGFPRTLSQARDFDRCLAELDNALDAVILMDVPDATVLERITGRRADPQTGRIYHLKYNPPPPEILSRLEQREDDTEEVMQERLDTYHREIDPVIEHYEGRSPFLRIDGTASEKGVFDAILDRLQCLAGDGRRSLSSLPSLLAMFGL